MHGLLLDGRYQLQRKLQEEPTGTTLLAQESASGREVEILLVRRELSALAELARRFDVEAAALATAGDEGLAAVLSHGRLPSGELYLVTEHTDGLPLQELVDTDGPLSYGRILRIAGLMARSLALAHTLGALHRALRPEQVVVSLNAAGPGLDKVKLTHFGLANILGSAHTDAFVTISPARVGSPAYLSPEQICGEEPGPATDIYAFGCTLFFMVTGVQVFGGKRPTEVVIKHLKEPPPRLEAAGYLRWCPPPLEDLIHRCLAKLPEERYPSAAALLDALEAVRRSIGQLRGQEDAELEVYYPYEAPAEPRPPDRAPAGHVASSAPRPPSRTTELPSFSVPLPSMPPPAGADAPPRPAERVTPGVAPRPPAADLLTPPPSAGPDAPRGPSAEDLAPAPPITAGRATPPLPSAASPAAPPRPSGGDLTPLPTIAAERPDPGAAPPPLATPAGLLPPRSAEAPDTAPPAPGLPAGLLPRPPPPAQGGLGPGVTRPPASLAAQAALVLALAAFLGVLWLILRT